MCCCRSRVFVLGPSHHYYTRQCCLSPAGTYNTPLGVFLYFSCMFHLFLLLSVVSMLHCLNMTRHHSPVAGPIEIAMDTYQELQATGEFDIMDIDVDEVRQTHAPNRLSKCRSMACPAGQHIDGNTCRQSTVWSCRWLTLPLS